MYNVNAKKNDSMLILCLIISNFLAKDISVMQTEVFHSNVTM